MVVKTDRVTAPPEVHMYPDMLADTAVPVISSLESLALFFQNIKYGFHGQSKEKTVTK